MGRPRNPFRLGVRRRRSGARVHQGWRIWQAGAVDRVVLRVLGRAALGLFAVVTIAFSIYVLKMPPPVDAYASQQPASPAPLPSDSPTSPSATAPREPTAARALPSISTSTTALQKQIVSALTARSFPTLKPSIDALASRSTALVNPGSCDRVAPWNSAQCVYGAIDSKKTVALLGDASASGWLPGLVSALEPSGYRIQSFVSQSCPTADVRVREPKDTSLLQSCAYHRRWATTELQRIRPDLIVVSDSHRDLMDLESKAVGSDAAAEWKTAAARSWSELTDIAPTFVLGSPPGSRDIRGCIADELSPGDCVKTRSGDPTWALLRRAELDAGKSSGATYVDTSAWFCSTSSHECPSFVAHTPVYVDGKRLTREYSQKLAPPLSQAIDSHARE